MTTKGKKKNSADMCRKTGKEVIPGMPAIAQIAAISDYDDGLYEDEFCLFDCNEILEINRYYSDKKTSWINVNFEEQLNEYRVTSTYYSCIDRHRWFSNLLYLYTTFVSVSGDQGKLYSKFLLPERELVCKAVGVSTGPKNGELDLSKDRVNEKKLAVRAEGKVLVTPDSPPMIRKRRSKRKKKPASAPPTVLYGSRSPMSV